MGDMATEASGQGPTIFEQVSVCFTEVKEFVLDPYLFELSGSNLQQYCTMLSWLEQQNPKPEMFLETSQDISVPLSLVQVVEEFEFLPYSYQEEGTMHIKPSEPPLPEKNVTLVKLQYNFRPKLRSCVLKGKPSNSSAASKLQEEAGVKRAGLVSPEENLSPSPDLLKADDRDRKGQIGESEATIWPQEESPQPPAAHLFVTEQSGKTIPEEGRSDLLPGGHSRRGSYASKHPTGGAFLHTEGRNYTSGHLRECSDEPRPLSVHKGMISCTCPACGNLFRINQNPVTRPLIPSNLNSFQCPECGHSIHAPVGRRCQSMLANQRDGQLRCQKIRKDGKAVMVFRCPDCGRGFEHKSSLYRHWRRYHRGNEASVSKPPNFFARGPKHIVCEKTSAGPVSSQACELRPVRIYRTANTATHQHDPPTSPQSSMGWEMILPQPPRFQGDPTCVMKPFVCLECGKRFTTKDSMIRHQHLHQAVRPFKCSCCDKSYIQRSHLKRHVLEKHGSDLLRRVSL